MNHYRKDEYEQEIDLVSLCWRILEHWKSILILALFCGILGCFGKYAQDIYSLNSLKDDSISVDKKIESIFEINPTERFSVEQLVQLRQDCEFSQKQLEASIFMKLDAADARKMRIVYMLSSRDKLILQEVRKVYTENLPGEELAEQLHKEVDNTYSVEQWEGLLRDSMVLHNRSIIELSDKNKEDDLMAATLKANQDDFYSYIVTFAVYLLPDMDEQAVADCVDTWFQHKKNSNPSASELTLKQIDCVVEWEDEALLRDYQQTKMSSVNNAIADVIGKEEALSEAQETYYELIKDSNSVDKEKKTLVEKAVAEKRSQISIKYLIMGLFGGLVVSCGFWGLRYIFSNRLLDAEEMQNRFGGILFGFLEQKSLRNHKREIVPKDQQLEAIAVRIELYCKQKGIEKIGLIGSSTELLHGEEVKKIKDFLSALGVDVQVIGNVYLDVEALKKGIDVGKAIVVEGTGVSIYGEMENLIQKSIEYNIELLGSVVL